MATEKLISLFLKESYQHYLQQAPIQSAMNSVRFILMPVCQKFLSPFITYFEKGIDQHGNLKLEIYPPPASGSLLEIASQFCRIK